NSDKRTLLMYATKYANCEIIKEVLDIKNDKGDRCVEVNAQDKNGYTALTIAFQEKSLEKTLLLLKYGANIQLAK
ncbi:hypothetical protein BCR36DRAFT_232404, partial [Piromyces finnis]